MAIGCVLILNSRGDILCSRNYRDMFNVRTVGEPFRTQVIMTKLSDRCPVHNIGGISYLFTRHSNVWFVCCTKQNSNAALVFQFMNKCVEIFKRYFGDFTEETVRDNHVTILELLDEVLDYGYPQITETDILQLYITNAGMKAEAVRGGAESSKQLSDKVTGIIGWRKEGIRHKKNEVFIDVVEEVNVLIASNGNVLQRDVTGRVEMKSFLSGMPECKFGLNDRLMVQAETSKGGKNSQIDLEDTTFHQCVRLGKFESNRSISFVPPDGSM